MLTDVLVVGHRPQLKEALAQRLEAMPTPVCRLRAAPGASPSRRPQARLVVADVVGLFPGPHDRALQLGHPIPSRIVVMGWRSDLDPLLAAFGEGLPVYLLDDLRPAALGLLLGPDCADSQLYRRLARLSSERVQRLMARRASRRDLTRQERRITELLPSGLTNQQIAQRLGSEEKTVKNHLTHIYDKLGVGGRVEAVALLLAQREAATPRPLPR